MAASTKNATLSDLNLTVKILAFSLLLFSCNQRKVDLEIPSNIIGKDSMVAILTDIHLVEGAKVGRRIMGDTLSVDYYYHKVYDKHSISKEEFEESFDFYNKRPEIMDEIYELVLESLNSIEFPKEKAFENQSDKEHKGIIDSIEKNVIKKSNAENLPNKNAKNP